MYSMTGYGEAKARLNNKITIRVEIRSVNNRFLNVKMNLPEVLNGYESNIEKIIHQHIHRGSLNFSVKLGLDDDKKLVINKNLLKDYYTDLKNISHSLGLKEPLTMQTIISMPGVFEPAVKTGSISPKDWILITKVIKQALINLAAMRQREGHRLRINLQNHLKKITGLVKRIEKQAPRVLANFEAKFRSRLENILEGHGLAKEDKNQAQTPLANNLQKNGKTSMSLEQSIAIEIAQFVQRADINEEVHRLESHVKEFSDSLKQDREMGKKLDFISQEILREINTIGSKSADSAITYSVIALKNEIEKIREQVQNIE